MRKQEEQINQEKFTFEKEVLEKAEKAANLDRDMLSRHQQRLSEFEKHLLAKFNLVLEEYRSRVANDVEFHFSKRRQVTFFLQPNNNYLQAIDSVVDDEIEYMDKIQKENSKFDSYVQEALDRIRGEIAHMGLYCNV